MSTYRVPSGAAFRRRALSLMTGLMGLFLLADNASASPVPDNPDPSLWAPDNGASIFSHPDQFLAIERYRIETANGTPAYPAFFGFYFNGAPTPLPWGTGAFIFDPGDLEGSQAYVDFNKGVVWDLEDSTVRSRSKIMPPGPAIGFLLTLELPGAAGPTYTSIFTDPTEYLNAFNVPRDGDNGGHTVAYRVQILGGIAPVPLPGSGPLTLGTGLALLLLSARGAGERLQEVSCGLRRIDVTH